MGFDLGETHSAIGFRQFGRLYGYDFLKRQHYSWRCELRTGDRCYIVGISGGNDAGIIFFFAGFGRDTCRKLNLLDHPDAVVVIVRRTLLVPLGRISLRWLFDHKSRAAIQLSGLECE